VVAKVGIEDIALQALARLLDEFGDALETHTKRVSEDLVESVASYRIVGNFAWRDRLAGKKPAAVHCCEAFVVDRRLVPVLGCFCAYDTVSTVGGMLSLPCDCPSDWLDS
jgi:hypothetical protein